MTAEVAAGIGKIGRTVVPLVSAKRRKNGRPLAVVERQIAVSELAEAAAKGELKEAFGTGTAAVVTPVESLSSKAGTWTLGEPGFGPLSQWLFDEITAIQYGEKPDRFNWLESI